MFSGVGCMVLIAVNVVFVPRYGYTACAWGGFAGYMTAMVLSYLVGQKYYPIDYPIKEMAMYVVLTFIIYVVMTRLCPQLPVWAALIVNTLHRSIYGGCGGQGLAGRQDSSEIEKKITKQQQYYEENYFILTPLLSCHFARKG